MKRVTSILVRLAFGLFILGVGAWGTLAILLTGDETDHLRLVLATLFGLSSIIALVCLVVARWRSRVLLAYLLPLVALFFWYQGIEPSNSRQWQTDVAVLPYATIVGDKVTVHNIRNFEYRSETDYTPAYYDKQFELSQLSGVDLVASYWMGPAIAHVFLSFAFADGEHLARGGDLGGRRVLSGVPAGLAHHLGALVGVHLGVEVVGAHGVSAFHFRSHRAPVRKCERQKPA